MADTHDPEATLRLPESRCRPKPRRRRGLGVGARLGPWRLELLSGEGSFGCVFRARHVRSGSVKALKVLHAALAGTTEAVSGFLQEARLSARVVHPAVVSAEEVRGGRPGEPSWSVSRWVEGSALSTLLSRGPLPLVQALWTGRGLASALAAVHAAGVVHGDCKPDNVMLAADGGVHLVDFGSAWELGREPRTLQGTPAYLAPEAWTEGPLDARVDLYAFGCLLFALLTGRPPFLAPQVGAVRALHRESPLPPLPSTSARGEEIPAGLRALVAACLEKSPRDRPSSAGEIAAQLHPILTSLQSLTRTGSALPQCPHVGA